MKVLVYTSLYPNHKEPNKGVFVHQRMRHFAMLDNCEIKVVNPIPYCPPWSLMGRWYAFSKIKQSEVIDGIDVFHPRYPLLPKISMPLHGVLMFLGTLKRVREIRRKFNFDLIDGHYIYPDGFAAVLLGIYLKVPVVLTARGSDIHSFSRLNVIKPLIQWALDHAVAVISVCDALRKRMSELGVVDAKMHTISNGVSIDRFTIKGRQDAKTRLNIPPDQKIILSVGSLLPNKGFHVIIDAMPDILKSCSNVRLVIIGKGPFGFDLEKRISNLGLAKHVNLVGEIDNSELMDWYNAGDVFCLASKREGWANVIMESLACGTPVVATKVWGAPEIITSQNVGVLVERNSKSIATAIKDALGKTWDREAIHNHVSRRTWKRVAQDIRSVFQFVLKSASHNP